MTYILNNALELAGKQFDVTITSELNIDKMKNLVWVICGILQVGICIYSNRPHSVLMQCLSPPPKHQFLCEVKFQF